MLIDYSLNKIIRLGDKKLAHVKLKKLKIKLTFLNKNITQNIGTIQLIILKITCLHVYINKMHIYINIAVQCACTVA